MEEDQIEINYDRLIKLGQTEVIEAKFNIMTTIQPKAYDKETYKAEEEIVVKNEKGEDEVKEIPLTDHIRWRYGDNTKAEADKEEIPQFPGFKNTNPLKKIESNAKIVEWSDGSFQLIIGEEYYDIMFSKMVNVRYGVEDQENDLFIVNKPINQRMILTPSEFSSHVKKTEKVINNDESNSKVKLAYSFYDKQKYNKDEFRNKYGRKNKMSPPSMKIDKSVNKKRKRSSNSDF